MVKSLTTIRSELDRAATGPEDLGNIIAQTKMDIFETLNKDTEAVNVDDKSTLNLLIASLHTKKSGLEKDFGLVGTLDFRTDDKVLKDVKDLCSSAASDIDMKNCQDTDLCNDIDDLLQSMQLWDKKDSSKTLFHKKITNSAHLVTIMEALGNPSIANTMKNDYLKVETSKLFTKEQRTLATRLMYILYNVIRLTHDKNYDSTKKRNLKTIVDAIKTDIAPKLKGLYNTKRSLDKTEMLNGYLEDLKQKKGDYPLENADYDSTVTIDLGEFLHGKVSEMDHFILNKTKITDDKGHNFVLKTTTDAPSELKSDKNENNSVILEMELRPGVSVPIASLEMINKLPPKFIVVFDKKDKIESAISATGERPENHFPVTIDMKITGEKKVRESPLYLGGSNASLTKKVSIHVPNTLIPGPGPIPGPIPGPTPRPAPLITPIAKEWSATISSVENVHSEEAAYLAEEKDREDFDKLGELSLGKLGTWHPWERMKHFISREYKRKKAIKNHMRAVKGKIDTRRESVTSASNRHELEFGDIQWNKGITQLTTHENADVNRLCVTYLKSNMKDADFEKEFNQIIANDPIIEPMIKNNKMDYLGSNILLKLKQERAEQVMMDKIGKLLLKDVNATTLEMRDDYDETKFKADLKAISDEYFAQTQSNFPKELRDLLDASKDKTLMLPILQNWKAQLQANVKNLRMHLQLLNNTTGAYEIDNEDREKSLWQRFGNWMDNHRILTIGGSAVLGTGMLVGGSIIGGPLGAGIATGLLATKMGVMNAAKKASHYTKEQKGQEKRLTHGLNIEKQSMENIKKVMDAAPWYSWRKYKAKRQYELYQETTQHKIADTEYLTKKIQGVLSTTTNLDDPANANERDIIEGYIINALVRLDYYKEVGHNFVGSQNRTKIEQDFNMLYQAVQQGALRLYESRVSPGYSAKYVIQDALDDIRTGDSRYSDLRDALEDDYEKAFSTFKKRRAGLAAKYGIGSAIIYGGTALLAQYVMGSGVFGNYQIVKNIPGTSTYELHPEVKNSLLSNGVPSSKVTAIEDALKASPTGSGSYNPEAFWTIVKNETGWTDVQLNNWVSNSFMKDVLWKLNEGGTLEFKKALIDGHFDTLRPGDALFTRAESFLSSPRIGILRPGEGSTVLKNLQDYLSGAKNFTDFSPEMRIKMGHFGHMAIHNDIGSGSRLTEEVLNTVTTGGGTEVSEGVKHFFFDGVGMPLYANTYRKKMIPNEEERGRELKNSDPGAIPEGDEFITADPDGSSSGPSSGAGPSWI